MKALSIPAMVLLLVTVGWLHADDKKKETGKSVLKKLEGKWKMDAMEVNGRENPQADRMGAVIRNGAILLTRDGKATFGGNLVLNPNKDPATVDWKWTSGITAGKTSMGIYKLEEDTLTICMNQAQGKGSDKRPSNFTTKPTEAGSGSILYVLKKQK